MMADRAHHPTPPRGPTVAFVVTLLLLGVGLIPTGDGAARRSLLGSLHRLEPNRADRSAQATGYYAGLIDGPSTGRDELTLTLLGKPPEWAHFTEINAARYLHGTFLQFELRPNLDLKVLGTHFTTNGDGLRDRPYTREKPADVFRIALLGSSIDMGWGVDTDQTYENRLEDWLNMQAKKRGLRRRFEVLNFAMAAYSPLHRLEVYEMKVRDFQPDMVLYSATRLDTRLLQIHLVSMLQDGVDLKYPFVRAGVQLLLGDATKLPRDPDGHLRDKEAIKARIEPILWSIDAATVGHLAASCRASGTPLYCLIVPRANDEDSSTQRGPDVKRMLSIAAKHRVPVIDLSATFDTDDPSEIEIAPWDDHPNVHGHEHLFFTLARSIVNDRALHDRLFGESAYDAPPAKEAQ